MFPHLENATVLVANCRPRSEYREDVQELGGAMRECLLDRKESRERGDLASTDGSPALQDLMLTAELMPIEGYMRVSSART